MCRTPASRSMVTSWRATGGLAMPGPYPGAAPAGTPCDLRGGGELFDRGDRDVEGAAAHREQVAVGQAVPVPAPAAGGHDDGAVGHLVAQLVVVRPLVELDARPAVHAGHGVQRVAGQQQAVEAGEVRR